LDRRPLPANGRPAADPVVGSGGAERSEARAMVNQMLELIGEMEVGERVKEALPLGTPEFVERAREVERIARIVFRWSQMQLQIAEEAARRRATGELTDMVRLIDVVPRPLDVIVANWREAQVRLETARPGSYEALAAADDIEILREEYQVNSGHREGRSRTAS